MQTIIQDVRYALRQWKRSPAFLLVASMTLALGIGANVLIFTIVSAVLLKPLGAAHPERLVSLHETWSTGFGSVSWLNYQDWASRTRSFTGMAAYRLGSANLQSTAEPERVPSVQSTANFFTVLDAPMKLGRGFLPGEDGPGAACVAVLTERLWRKQFGADPHIVGHHIALNGAPCSITGVAGKGFEFPVGMGAGLWVAVHPAGEEFANRGTHFLSIVARLRDGVDLAAAQNDLKGVAQQLAPEFPKEDGERSASVLDLRETISGGYRSQLAILSAAVGAVLLLACVNVGNMTLARASARRHEIALRSALGASDTRLIRQFLTDSLLLALVSTGAGAYMATLALHALKPFLSVSLPDVERVSMDWRVLVFAAMAGLLAAVLFGLAPALYSVRGSITHALRDSGSSASPHRGMQRFRGGLIVLEMGVSFVLLVMAAMLSHSLFQLYKQDTGMTVARTLAFKITPSKSPSEGNNLATKLYTPLLERLRSFPGVESAAMVNALPLEEYGLNGGFGLPGHASGKDAASRWAEFRVVSPGFYSALGIVIMRGRDFTEHDTLASERVAVVNDTFATTYLGTLDVLGQQISELDDKGPYTIIGVYRAYKQEGVGAKPDPEIDLAYTQVDPKSIWAQFTLQRSMAVVLHSSQSYGTLLSSARKALAEIDATLPLSDPESMDEVVGNSLGGERLMLLLIGSFAGLALALALIGMYGVTSYYVTQRTREIGIRMALGATRRGALQMVMKTALKLSLIGIAAGIVGAWAGIRLIRSLVFAGDAGSFYSMLALTAVLLVLAAVAAAWIPARRAASVDPIHALRAE
jgi:predicted permease